MKLLNAIFVGLFLGVGLATLQKIFGGFVDQAPAWYARVGAPFVLACLALGFVITVLRQPTMERFVNFGGGVLCTACAPFFIGIANLAEDSPLLPPQAMEMFCVAVMLLAASVPIVSFFVGLKKSDAESVA